MSVPTRAEALSQLQILTDRLASNRVQLSDLEAAAHRAKVETWMAAQSEYISERDRIADFAALDLTVDMMTLRGEIAADLDQIHFLDQVIQWVLP